VVVVARVKVGGLRVSMCVRKRGFQGGIDILGLRRNVMAKRDGSLGGGAKGGENAVVVSVNFVVITDCGG